MTLLTGPQLNQVGGNNSMSAEDADAVIATITDMFEYHKPTDAQLIKFEKVRAALISAANVIIANVPPSADRSAAIRKLREVRMDCNSAISHNGKY